MSGISTTIKLIDQMTAPMMSIQHALSGLENSFNALDTAAEVDASTLAAMRNQIEMSDAAARVLADNMQLVVDGIEEMTPAQKNFNESVRQSNSLADGLASKIGAAVAAYASIQGVKGVLGLSDEMAQTTARLNLMNDGLQTTEELWDKIFSASKRSRGSASAMADSVSKLGLMAGDAFSSNDEVIAFAEQLNKMFIIAGTGAQGVESVMYNLTQALSSGFLRGQDLNSVISNTQPIVQAIAEYLDIPIGKVREWASEGLITSEIVKNAVLSMASDINEMVEEMPYTWGQVWQGIADDALLAFQPLLERLNEIANSEGFQRFAANVSGAFSTLASAAAAAFDRVLLGFSAVRGFIADNFQPILIATIALVGLFAAKTIAAGISAFAGFMLAHLPLVLLTVAFVGVIAHLNKMGHSFEEIFGFVGQIVGVAVASIVNIFIDLWNFLADFANNFARIFDDPIAGIVGLFVSMATFVLGLLTDVATVIDTIFGTELSSAIAGFKGNIQDWYNEAYGPTEEFVKKMEYVNTDEWGTQGKILGEKFGGFLENPSSLIDSNLLRGESYGGFSAQTDLLDSMNNGIGTIAANTSKQLDYSEEDLKLWRDIAERDTINRFTTAEVTVEFGDVNNNVSSYVDLDGVAAYIGERVEETLFEVAQGVYA